MEFKHRLPPKGYRVSRIAIELAQRAADPLSRAGLLEMAQEWRDLADKQKPTSDRPKD